jgi:hypothetical protein
MFRGDTGNTTKSCSGFKITRSFNDTRGIILLVIMRGISCRGFKITRSFNDTRGIILFVIMRGFNDTRGIILFVTLNSNIFRGDTGNTTKSCGGYENVQGFKDTRGIILSVTMRSFNGIA